MPKLNFQTIPETDLGAGIDQQSAENQILPGYCEDIINADPKSTGQISKRKGYQGYSGYVPVRVDSLVYNNNELTLKFPDDVRVPVNRDTPIIIKGVSGLGSGDFDSEQITYFESINSDVRYEFTSGGDTATLTESDHQIPAPSSMFVGVAESLNPSTLDNTVIEPDNIDIATADNDLVVTVDAVSDKEMFIYTSDKTDEAGDTVTIEYASGIPTGTLVLTIPETGTGTPGISPTSHGLDEATIIPQFYFESGGTKTKITPDKFTVNETSKEVEVTIVNNDTPLVGTLHIVLSTAPTENFNSGAVGAKRSIKISIDKEVEGGTDFVFIGCYLETTGSDILELVVPDSITTDNDTGDINVSFTNNSPDGATFEVYWEFADIVSNTLTVTATNIGTRLESADPEMIVYGLCHDELYGTSTSREGWANHIDTYRAVGENRLIAGLGGNLFSAQLRDESNNATNLLMPALYPRINGRLASDSVIGPAFYDTGETPGRTRGYITGDDGVSNYFEITDITWQSSTGTVRYTLLIPNLSFREANGDVKANIIGIIGTNDLFTVQQTGHSINNGTFSITGIDETDAVIDIIYIDVDNSSVTNSDYDEEDVGGLGGIFTDELTLQSDSEFLNGDSVEASLLTDTDTLSVASSDGTSVILDGVIEVKSFPANMRLAGTRTTAVVPLRDGTVASVVNIVRGDMLNFTNYEREFRVLNINQNSDETCSVTGDGSEATVTLTGGGTTSNLHANDKLMIRGTDNFNGTIVITALESDTTFTFESDITGTETGVIVGKTVTIDEEASIADDINNSNVFTVPARWCNITAPSDNYDLTPERRISYFDSSDYINQSIIRSTMVQDNLYLTNFDDEVMKFDGTNLYRAGLYRWQTGMFLNIDTANPTIVISSIEVSFLNHIENTNIFKVTTDPEQVLGFRAGDLIKDSRNDELYTVRNVELNNAEDEGRVIVDKAITQAYTATDPGTLSTVVNYKYYFRLNAIDRNNNIVASAVTGSEDFAVQLSENATIQIRLLAPPAFDNYDYDRITVQTYRTKASTAAPFYLAANVKSEFDKHTGYIDIYDTLDDEDLIQLDETMSALKGAELGTAWEQPPRAKYCTSIGNRLVLGNLKEYPEVKLDIFQGSSSEADIAEWLKVDNKLWTLTSGSNTETFEFVANSTAITAATTGTTSFTITAAVTATEGDWLYIGGQGATTIGDLEGAGWYQVTDASASPTFTLSGRLDNAAILTKKVSTATSGNVPVFLGDDISYGMKNGNTSASNYTFLAMRRLADAINSVIRNNSAGTAPWVVANAGNEYGFGTLILRQPKIISDGLSLTVPTLANGNLTVFGNDVKLSGSETVSAVTRSYPSRIVASYPNYPEIFDNIQTLVDSESDSVVDINSADGQEITAIVPFFGEAAFGAAQKSSIIVVFKSHSIYLVDLDAKARGEAPVQRLETRGKGCTAPYSVAVTKDGIMFANDTGIYRLGRDLRVNYIGRKYERLFQLGAETAKIDLFTGHNSAQTNKYKLSYTASGELSNSKVAVYDNTREYEGKGEGSWTTYTNHPATGWATLASVSYFSTTSGRVFKSRTTNDASDYRDDNQAIDMTITTRALHQGQPAMRKVFRKVITHYRPVTDAEGTSLTVSMGLSNNYESTDAFIIDANTDTSGLDNTGQYKIVTISSSVGNKVSNYIQLQYTNSSIDEGTEIAGFDLEVGAKSTEGLTEAKNTTE